MSDIEVFSDILAVADVGQIQFPLTNGVIALQTTSVAGRLAGQLYVYEGAGVWTEYTPSAAILAAAVIASGAVPVQLEFKVAGAISAGTKLGAINLYAPFAFAISEVHTAVNTAPTGATLIVDVNKNGTTIFTTQSARPAIAISAFAATSGAPAITAVAKNDILTIDADQVGSSVAGSDLVVQIRGVKS